MKARLRSTPLAAFGPPLGEDLVRWLGQEDLTQFDAVVAWAKRSGLRRVEAAVRGFRARAGKVRLIVGIDEFGATKQGLTLARELADEMWIFHEPAGGTFHPKVYVLRGERRGVAVIGSANLTRGGLFSNYEASVQLDLELPADSAFLDDVDSWIEALRSEPQLCLSATDELMARVLASPGIADEEAKSERRDDESAGNSPLLPFGARVLEHSAIPRLSGAGDRAVTAAKGVRPREGTPPPPPVETRPGVGAIERRWLKKLDASSAQRPPSPTTNPTGVLRLNQAGLDIDWRTFFREILFGGATWAPIDVQGQPGEEAYITFDVSIDGNYFGKHAVRISYAAHREAGQGNVTTVLHWGEAVGGLLQVRDYTGWWVVLDRDSSGQYGLTIQQAEPHLI